jgi:nitrogen regulatory protein PII
VAKEKSSRFSFKLPFKLPKFMTGSPPAPPVREAKTLPALKLVFFIVEWTNTNILSQVFEEEKVRFHFVSKGRGTARSEVLDLLGIGASDKAVVICLEQDLLAPILIKEVRKKLGSHGPGAGIAFTVPLSGINTPILKVFKQSIHQNEKIASEKQGGTPMAAEIKNDLIISIINQGYSDEFMTAAREAGATGGTVINARGQAHEGPVKFFGISVQDEKEIIIILTSREKKVPIMQAVSQTCGMASKAEGIVFSLPVDTVMGLSFE